jgi:alkaline phosphatase D
MQRLPLALLALFLSLPVAAGPVPERIAFGSCLRQDEPQPIWATIRRTAPDLMLLLGDNVYADTTDPDAMRAAYAKLGANSGFRALRRATRLLATWDDHDYGRNDAGRGFPAKAAAQAAFLDFFEAGPEDPRRQRPGVYQARIFGPPGKRVQVILLDTRYFRSPLKRASLPKRLAGRKYQPQPKPTATMLGAAQWRWLGKQLRKPAEVRLLASSIQVIPTQHGWEKWANLPRERQRLLDLIRETGAGGVVLLSGDRHLGEISRLPAGKGPGYPLYEVTASGLNSAGAGEGEANRFRVTADNLRVDHFGLIRIDWAQETLHLELRDVAGESRQTVRVPLAKLQP